MGTLRVIAIIVLIAVICCGTIIKIYTRRFFFLFAGSQYKNRRK